MTLENSRPKNNHHPFMSILPPHLKNDIHGVLFSILKNIESSTENPLTLTLIINIEINIPVISRFPLTSGRKKA